MSRKAVVPINRLKPDFGIRFSRTHLDRKEDDGSFPLSFKLGDHRNSPRVYWEHEIIEYLERCAKASTDAPK